MGKQGKLDKIRAEVAKQEIAETDPKKPAVEAPNKSGSGCGSLVMGLILVSAFVALCAVILQVKELESKGFEKDAAMEKISVENNKLIQELDQVTKDKFSLMKSVEEKIALVETTQKNSNEALEKVNNEKGKLIQETNNLQGDVQSTKKEIELNKEMLNLLNEERNSFLQNNKKLQEEIENCKTMNEGNKENLQSTISNLEEVASKFKLANDQISLLEKTIGIMKEEKLVSDKNNEKSIQALKKENNNLREEKKNAVSFLQAQISNLENTIATMRDETEELNKQMILLQKSIASAKEREKSLEKNAEEKDSQIEDIITKNNELWEENEITLASNMETIVQLEVAKEKFAVDKAATEKKLQNKIKAMEDSNKALIKEHFDEIASNKALIKEKIDEIAELELKFKADISVKESWITEVTASYEEEVKKQTEENNALKEKLTTGTAKFTTKIEALQTELKEKLKNHQEQLIKYEKNNEELIENMEKERNMVRSEKKEFNQKLERMEADTQAKLKQLFDDNETIRKEMETNQAMFVSKKGELESEISAAMEKLGKLESDKSAMQSSMEIEGAKFESEKEQWQMSLQNMEESLNDNKKEGVALQEKLDKVMKEKESLTKKLGGKA